MIHGNKMSKYTKADFNKFKKAHILHDNAYSKFLYRVEEVAQIICEEFNGEFYDVIYDKTLSPYDDLVYCRIETARSYCSMLGYNSSFPTRWVYTSDDKIRKEIQAKKKLKNVQNAQM